MGCSRGGARHALARIAGSIATLCAATSLGCKSETFACAGPEDCSGGMCQPTGYCSFPDAECTSGQRYGEHAAPGYAGTCVGGDAGTGTTSGTTALPTTEATTSSDDDAPQDSSNEGAPPPDLATPPLPCIDVDFEIVPIPGWEAFADGALASVTDGRLIVDLPETGDGAAGIVRASTDLAARTFTIELASVPDPASLARIGLVVTGDGVAYGVHVGGGRLLASRDDGSGENVLVSLEYGEPTGLVLELALADTVAYRARSDALGEVVLAEQPAALATGEVRLVAASEVGNRIDPGEVVVEHLQDCPTASEATRPQPSRLR